MNVIELFAGIAGFGLGLERAGMTVVAQVEIDPKARAVLSRHWPDTPRFDDVRTFGRKDFGGSVDLIAGGFPCQDVSLAGRRAGLAGERSGLFFEFLRVVDEFRPMWVVIENVPGLLSSNGGRDIQIVIDSLTQIGYTVDVDIKDAQEFGVAQRRRRVFLTCVRLDDLLKQRTPLSRRISADLLAQILLNIWGAIPQVLSLVPLHSVYEKPIEQCVNLLVKMTSLLETTQEKSASKKSLNILDGLLAQFGGEVSNSESGLIEKNEPPAPLSLARAMCEYLLSETGGVSGEWNISTLLSSALADACDQESKSIISTLNGLTIDQKIFIFSVVTLNIIALMLPSLDWSIGCWGLAQSVSTLLQENMNYARQASNQLFIESTLRDSWRDYLCAASGVESELERCTRDIRAAEVLFERERLPGNPAPGRASQKEIAGTIGAGSATGGRRSTDLDGAGAYIVGALTSRQPSSDASCASQNHIVGVPDPAYAISGDGGKFGSGREGQDAFVLETRFALNGRGAPSDAIVPPLKAQSGSTGKGDSAPVIDFAHNFAGSANTNIVRAGEYAGALNVRRQDAVSGGFGVRRLTPTECERLQGFPDGWTDVPGSSDSARYRQAGNAVAPPVAEWIGGRIVAVETARQP